MSKTTTTLLWVIGILVVIIIIANWSKIKKYCGGGVPYYRGGGGIGRGGRGIITGGYVYPYSYYPTWICDERADGVNCSKCHSTDGLSATGVSACNGL